jgi:hypothetical protein
MKLPLIVRPEAERDLAEAHDWYESKVTGLGSEFLLAIDAALSSIQRTPDLYQVVYKNLRKGADSPLSLWDILPRRGSQDCGHRGNARPKRS